MQDQVHEWKTNADEILSKEDSFATPLIQLFLDIIENLVVLEKGISDGDEKYANVSLSGAVDL